ncbi:MAG: tonB-system energizer ExbB [Hyphomicrobium sp.]|nr:tonB-system energizer ExbB [Hyphomicrobium sp.]
MRGRNNRSTPRPVSRSLANSLALLMVVSIFCGHAAAQPLEPRPPGAETAADPAPTPIPEPSPPAAETPVQSPVPAANGPDAPAPSSSAAPEPLRASPPAGEAPNATTLPQPTADSGPTVTPPTAPSALPPPASAPPAQVLPHDLSPWGMFMAADIVVKAVMIGLALASLLTWTVWFAKSLELSAARRRLKRALAILTRSTSLADAAQKIGTSDRHARALIEQAELELRLSSDVLTNTGARDRIGTRLQQVVASAGRTMNRGTGVLATIGSTAPFIGLFGTVWGIMNSFIGISKSQTTNLAIVAPGIAEALLATAIGLVAAIPAVIIYNSFSRSISSYKALLADAASEVMRHVSRDLDRGLQAPPLRAAAE